MNLISVIVPVYKVEPYLRRCVDSILAQTYQDLEVILVDDGSPDNCPEICDEYAAQDERIKVIHKANGGLSSARNAGLDAASGDWVSFIDSDDWIEPDMYEILLRNAENTHAEISVGGVNDELVEQDRVIVTKTTYHGALKQETLSPAEAMVRYFTTSWAAWDKIYRRELFRTTRFPVGEINEDEAIVLKLLDACTAVSYTNQVFYHYIHRAQSITTSAFSEKKLAWCDHCEQNLRFIEDRHPELEGYAAGRYYSSVIWALNHMAENPKRYPDLIPEYRRKLKQIIGKYKGAVNISRKEQLRAYALMYLFGLYSAAVRLLGKHYS